ncbi:hypothetical protein TNCV_3762251 [Trichonephila clavipes]|nr:hypothetical protein TNCV_3762251 [Trichonephila clavipes]
MEKDRTVEEGDGKPIPTSRRWPPKRSYLKVFARVSHMGWDRAEIQKVRKNFGDPRQLAPINAGLRYDDKTRQSFRGLAHF